jgi:type IV pilus assembly protein PilB
LDFATVLRALLRQDPDIIMLGEIRDLKTADIAMQAAQTGHLVLSTLHTNNAIETINRLQSVGIASYHFISAVSLIIAQRLVRKLCDACKQPEIITETSININGFQAIGCDQCHQGYQGRIGIFECIPITKRLAKFILAEANALQLTDVIKQENYLSLWDAGIEKIKSGQTSYAELVRVIGKAA